MKTARTHPIVISAFSAFAKDVATPPTISLRAGDAIDGYYSAPPFDAETDAVTDAYLEKYYYGITYLDPNSFRHYVPHLIEYGLRHLQSGSNVTDSLLCNLHPPDRELPRFASLSPEQEDVIVKFLDEIAFADNSCHKAEAMTALEEWWAPGALYRPR